MVVVQVLLDKPHQIAHRVVLVVLEALVALAALVVLVVMMMCAALLMVMRTSGVSMRECLDECRTVAPSCMQPLLCLGLFS